MIEFDPTKAASNLVKHGVDFIEAATALDDPLARSLPDPDSQGEARWVSLGQSDQGRLLVVVWTERGEAIRLISARRATRTEEKTYAQGI